MAWSRPAVLPLAQWGPSGFWSATRALNLSPEDEAAIDDGTATLEQQHRAIAALQAAKERMMTLPCGVPDYSQRPS